MATVVPTSPILSRRVVVAIAAVLGVTIVFVSPLIALVLPLLIGVLALVFGVDRCSRHFVTPGTRQWLMRWTIASLLLHFLLGMVITRSSLWLYLGPDTIAYQKTAIELLRHWTSGFPMPENIPHGKEGFYYLLAGLYWLFGVSTGAGVGVNAVLSAGLVPLMTDTTRRLFGPKAARFVPPMVVLLPGLLIWTSQLLKEAPILFLMAVATNAAVRLTERFSPLPLVVLTTTLASLLTFRSHVALALAAGMVVGVSLGRRELFVGVGAGVSALTLTALLVTAVGLGYAGFLAASETDLRRANVVRQDLAMSAESGFARDVDIGTTRGALSYLPTGLTAFLFGPFPWNFDSPRQLPALIDVAVWWYLLPQLWRGFRRGRATVGRRQWVLLLPAAAITLVLSLAVGNFGLVVRERTQVVILVLPIIAFGLAAKAESRRGPSEEEWLPPIPVGPGLPQAASTPWRG